MHEGLPAEIQVEEEFDEGIQYSFPRRKWKPLRSWGLMICAFGTFWTAGILFWVYQAARPLFDPQGEVSLHDILFLLVGLPMLAVGGFLLFIGAALRSARSVISVRADELSYQERLGPISYTWRRPLNELKRCVVFAPGAVGKPAAGQEPQAGLAMLIAEFTTARRLVLAPGYPAEWLQALAELLAKRSSSFSDETAAAPIIEVVHGGDEEGQVERPDPPPGTHIALDRHPRGIAFTIPPAGLFKGSRGLFAFSLFWLAITATVTAVGGGAWMTNGDVPLPVVLLFVLLFWGVGIGTLCASIHMGRRQAVLAVVGDSIQFLQIGPFGQRRHEWQRDQIANVRVGPSGMEVNDVPVLELQVDTTDGKKHGMLSQRETAELEWIATILRRELPVHRD